MKRSRKNPIFTLAFTFVLMALLVVFIARSVYRTAFLSALELGDDKATAISADLENYMDTAKSVLWVAADTVDHMVAKGATDEEIIEYITRESTNTEEQFDESYTGIYGVIRGNYVDGVGWVPPADYDPTKRDWYKTTTAGKGEVVIVPPYVDAQTKSVIISIGRSLTDNKNALALDLTLDNVQEIVENIHINDYGYGFILDKDGMVIAHPDKNENGSNITDTADGKSLFEKIKNTTKGHFEAKIDGEECTVFVDEVMDQWSLVIVTKDAELYETPMNLLKVSVIITLIVYLLISTFYLLGYRSERKSAARMEEMKEIERKKDYEAKVLKLEKSAADSANKAKSNFLADMSHEIRTPINAILGMNEMILHESSEENTLDYASNIKSAGNTLLSIINSILDFSKIEDGRMSLVPVEFETAELVRGLVHSIDERARSKGLKLIVDIDETVPTVLMGDDVRISQVIMNLLTNAVKYTEKGNVRFSMKNLGMEKGLCRLYVSVKDTGIGIRKEDIDKLSISFERVDEKRNRHIEGTGLGISIVTKLLAMMDSELKIESEYGRGSDFYFELPIEVVDETPLGKLDLTEKVSVDSDSRKMNLRAPKARILITDDNETNLKVAANLMKLFGIKPELCSSGADTIVKMKDKDYDILFLDHMMPEMDGIETLKYLQEVSLIGKTKIIALTANAVVGSREQYIQAGFDDYLSKPIELPELEKMLKHYLPEDVKEEIPEVDKEKADKKVAVKKEAEINEAEIKEADKREAVNDKSGLKPDDDSRLGRLSSLGISVEDGITYCGGDEGFYLEIIGDYVKSAPERIEKLGMLLSENRMKDYKTLIHSVKSSSKTIGAMDMFEKAMALEHAVTEDNIDYVLENHESVMKDYKELVDSLSGIIG